jgi:hypothetical protein
MTNISVLKSRLTKADLREQQIKDEIKRRVEAKSPIFRGEFLRWNRALEEVRKRRQSIKFKLKRAEAALAKQQQMKQALDDSKRTRTTDQGGMQH